MSSSNSSHSLPPPAPLSPINKFFSHLVEGFSAQKANLMIDFDDADYDDNDIQTLTYSMNSLEEHLMASSSNLNAQNRPSGTSNRSWGGGVSSSLSERTNNSFDANADISSFVRERDYILRRMEATMRTRSKAKCVGHTNIRTAPLLPCLGLGFQDCMMIQDD